MFSRSFYLRNEVILNCLCSNIVDSCNNGQLLLFLMEIQHNDSRRKFGNMFGLPVEGNIEHGLCHFEIQEIITHTCTNIVRRNGTEKLKGSRI